MEPTSQSLLNNKNNIIRRRGKSFCGLEWKEMTSELLVILETHTFACCSFYMQLENIKAHLIQINYI